MTCSIQLWFPNVAVAMYALVPSHIWFIVGHNFIFLSFCWILSYITYFFHLTPLSLNILLCLPSSIKIMYYYLKYKFLSPQISVQASRWSIILFTVIFVMISPALRSSFFLSHMSYSTFHCFIIVSRWSFHIDWCCALMAVLVNIQHSFHQLHTACRQYDSLVAALQCTAPFIYFTI